MNGICLSQLFESASAELSTPTPTAGTSEALAGARQLEAWVPDREGMLAMAIDCYERQLSVMGRHTEAGVTDRTESPVAPPSVESAI